MRYEIKLSYTSLQITENEMLLIRHNASFHEISASIIRHEYQSLFKSFQSCSLQCEGTLMDIDGNYESDRIQQMRAFPDEIEYEKHSWCCHLVWPNLWNFVLDGSRSTRPHQLQRLPLLVSVFEKLIYFICLSSKIIFVYRLFWLFVVFEYKRLLKLQLLGCSLLTTISGQKGEFLRFRKMNAEILLATLLFSL